MKKILSLLFILFLLTSFNKLSIIFLLLIIILSLGIKTKRIKYPKIHLLLVAPILIGTISGISNNPYFILKDAYYFLLPFCLFSIGILFTGLFTLKQIFKFIIIAGTIMSFLRVILSVSFLGLQAFISPYDARYAYDTLIMTPIPIISLILILFLGETPFDNFDNKTKFLLGIINALGFYMFASRTYLIIFIIISFCIIFSKLNRSIQFLFGILICLMLFSQVTLSGIIPGSDSGFIGKLNNSFKELQLSGFDTEEDIVNNYRGYETSKALDGFFEKDQIINGGGFGSLVDLKTFIQLGDSDWRYIPVLHNGFVYILVKTGFLGLAFYALFIFMHFKKLKKFKRKGDRVNSKIIYVLLIGLVISLCITNFLVSGFFNLEMGGMFILISSIYTVLHQGEGLLHNSNHIYIKSENEDYSNNYSL